MVERMQVLMVSPYQTEDGIAAYTGYLGAELKNSVNVDIFPWNYRSHVSRIIAPLLRIPAMIGRIMASEVVHVQYVPGLFLYHLVPPLVVAKFVGTRIVLTMHEKNDAGFLRHLLAPLLFLHLLMADRVIVHTAEHAAQLARVRQKVHIIPHGIPRVDKPCTKRTVSGRILLPGFVNWWKGHDIALRACAALEHPYTLVFLGAPHDREYADEIERLMRELQLEHQVEWTREFVSKERFAEEFCAADVVLIPYRRITMSGILAHAIAYAKVTVLADIPPFREAVPHGVFFKSGDAADCARQLARALTDTQLRSSQEAYFETLREANSFSRAASRTIEVYHELT